MPAPADSLVSFLEDFLHEAAANTMTPILYIHGFDFSFTDATIWIADIASFYAADTAAPRLLPLVFTWPSVNRQTLQAYRADRASAQSSGHALARLLVALAEAWSRAGKPTLHLIAHSMGVFVLNNGLTTLAGSGCHMPNTLFAQAIVVAGDDDCSAFSADGGLRSLPSLARWVTIGINRNDAITSLDQECILHRSRLANNGPDDLTQLTQNVRVVDYTAAAVVHGQTPPGETDWDFWTHNYYHTVERVRADLAQALTDIAPDDVIGRVPAEHPPQTLQNSDSRQCLYVLPFPETLACQLQTANNYPAGRG